MDKTLNRNPKIPLFPQVFCHSTENSHEQSSILISMAAAPGHSLTSSVQDLSPHLLPDSAYVLNVTIVIRMRWYHHTILIYISQWTVALNFSSNVCWVFVIYRNLCSIHYSLLIGRFFFDVELLEFIRDPSY